MLLSQELAREAFTLTSFRTEMRQGSSQTVREPWGRGRKQGRHLGEFLWEADAATVSQTVAQGHHLQSCNIYFYIDDIYALRHDIKQRQGGH